jgi:hypothetical protein
MFEGQKEMIKGQEVEFGAELNHVFINKEF